MLEKNSDFFYFDAHFHYTDCLKKDCFIENKNIQGCSCALSIEDWNNQKKYSGFKIFGLHPLMVSSDTFNSKITFLEELCKEKTICGIGEAGFDFYQTDSKNFLDFQKVVFEAQLQLAIQFNLPLVIHCRKANEILFSYGKELAMLPGVLFHSFMGNSVEAYKYLQKGINGFFSFGKQLLNNNKKVIDCFKNLPLDRLLCETDAPYQFLKGEDLTYSDEIIKVYSAGYELRQNGNITQEAFINQLYKNGLKLFT